MKLKPILFSTPMVQAILDGRKTQTRRECKLKNKISPTFGLCFSSDNSYFEFFNGTKFIEGLKPKYQIGDILYVKETWSLTRGFFEGDEKVLYKADFTDEDAKAFHWKPSLFMPQAYARIFLKVTNVRVERLQDISEEDAIAEGIKRIGDGWKDYDFKDNSKYNYRYLRAIDSYKSLWNSINKKEPEKQWQANPYVFVYEFERVAKPEGMA